MLHVLRGYMGTWEIDRPIAGYLACKSAPILVTMKLEFRVVGGCDSVLGVAGARHVQN